MNEHNKKQEKPKKDRSLKYELAISLLAILTAIIVNVLCKNWIEHMPYSRHRELYLDCLMYLQLAADLCAWFNILRLFGYSKQIIMQSSKRFKGGMVYKYKAEVISQILTDKNNVIINTVDNGRINRICTCTFNKGHHVFAERMYYGKGKKYFSMKTLMEDTQEWFPESMIPVVKINGRSPEKYPYHYEWAKNISARVK